MAWYCFHNWTPWKDKEIMNVWDSDDGKYPLHIYLVQERRCQKCNKLQLRRVEK